MRGRPGLRGYLLDDRNTRHRDEALAQLSKLYDVPLGKIEAGVKDPPTKQGLIAILTSLRQASAAGRVDRCPRAEYAAGRRAGHGRPGEPAPHGPGGCHRLTPGAGADWVRQGAGESARPLRVGLQVRSLRQRFPRGDVQGELAAPAAGEPGRCAGRVGDAHDTESVFRTGTRHACDRIEDNHFLGCVRPGAAGRSDDSQSAAAAISDHAAGPTVTPTSTS